MFSNHDTISGPKYANGKKKVEIERSAECSENAQQSFLTEKGKHLGQITLNGDSNVLNLSLSLH